MKGETKMDAHEPHVRRRGFFLHSETGEPDAAEVENPEGFVVRVRVTRSVASFSTSISVSSAARASRVTSAAFCLGDAQPGRDSNRSGLAMQSRSRVAS